MTKSPWPRRGTGPTGWYENASGFLRLVRDNRNMWMRNASLKYLNIRVDTRSDHFILSGERGETITPDLVVAAIKDMPDYLETPDPRDVEIARLRRALEEADWQPMDTVPKTDELFDVWRVATPERPLGPVGRVENVKWCPARPEVRVPECFAHEYSPGVFHVLEERITHWRRRPKAPTRNDAHG